MNTIIMVLPNLQVGGAERVVAALAGELAGRGWKTILACGDASGPLRPEIDPRVELVELRAGRALAMIAPLRRLLRLHPGAVVFSSMTHTNLITLLAARLGRRHRGPVVVQEVALLLRGRERESRAKAAVFSLALRWLYPLADARLDVSSRIGQDFQERYAWPAGTFQTIPNPVDLERVKRGATEDPGHPWLAGGRPGKTLLGVGRLSHEKGFDVLLLALAGLAAQGADLRLLLVGDGPERAALAELARGLGLENRVEFLGMRPNPWQYMARADVLVVPSRAEGFAMVLVEAMFCGCQTASTRCGSAPPEILRQGQLGELARVDDPDSLARAVQRSLETPRPVEDLRLGALEFAKDRVAGMYERRFLDLLQGA